jgi:hypothetical protein
LHYKCNSSFLFYVVIERAKEGKEQIKKKWLIAILLIILVLILYFVIRDNFINKLDLISSITINIIYFIISIIFMVFAWLEVDFIFRKK